MPEKTKSDTQLVGAAGKKGQSHNETDMRRIIGSYGMDLKSAPDGWMQKYLENWELIS